MFRRRRTFANPMPDGFATWLRPGTGALRAVFGRDAENGNRAGRAPRQSPNWWPCASTGQWQFGVDEPNTKDEAFEEVVKSAQDAAVLVLVY
jgi:hypothetical protein